MPLGARDVFVIIHAKDQASRVITGVGRSFTTLGASAQAAAIRTMMMGQALIGLGTGLGIVGAAGIAAFAGMAKEAMAYNKQAALTLTQVDQTGVSVKQLADIGRRVASDVAAPFDQMQQGLFDIFSSMDVSVTEAEVLLKAFSKSAVAGQVDLQTAGRSTIAIMNAWNLPVSEANRVLDIQFQLVRKGVGTYEEFASTIGRAIPSARRAGSTVETLAGMLAFMTRNGLSAAMSATSAARAFDTISNQKVIERLKDMNINVLDGAGNFRQMNDIVTDLARSMSGLTDAEKAARLQEIFQGSGNTIQARRFFDMAIRNYEELNQRVQEMINSSGALEDAYKIMLEDPAVMAQLLDNNLKSLRTEFGDAFIPVITQVITWLIKLLQWFNDLSPAVKQWVAWIGLATSALLLLIGVATAAAGVLLVLHATATMFGTTLLGMSGWLLAIAAAIAGLAYLVITNWDTIKGWWEEFWPGFKQTAIDTWNSMFEGWDAFWAQIKHVAHITWQWLQEKWDVLLAFVKRKYEEFRTWFTENWPAIWSWVKETAGEIWQRMQVAWDALWGNIKLIAGRVWHWLQEEWDKLLIDEKAKAQVAWEWIQVNWDKLWTEVKRVASIVWGWIKTNGPGIWEGVRKAVQEVWEMMQDFWDWVEDTFWPGFLKVWNTIKKEAWPIIENTAIIIAALAVIIKKIWDELWPYLAPVVKAAWELITGMISAFITFISGLLQVWAGLLTLDWTRFWNGLKDIVSGVWQAIRTIIGFALDMISNQFRIIGAIWVAIWSGLWGALKAVFDWGVNLVSTAVSPIINALQTVVGWMNFLIGVARIVWNAIKDAFDNTLPVGGILGPLGSIIGFLSAIVTIADRAWSAIRRAVGASADLAKAVGRGVSPPSQANLVPGIGLATGGPFRIGQQFAVGESGFELMRMGTGGVGQIVPNALAEHTLSRNGGPSEGSGTTQVILQVQGPITDRQDLVYRAAGELDWYDFTRGR